jgi:hypothetical protein
MKLVHYLFYLQFTTAVVAVSIHFRRIVITQYSILDIYSDERVHHVVLFSWCHRELPGLQSRFGLCNGCSVVRSQLRRLGQGKLHQTPCLIWSRPIDPVDDNMTDEMTPSSLSADSQDISTHSITSRMSITMWKWFIRLTSITWTWSCRSIYIIRSHACLCATTFNFMPKVSITPNICLKLSRIV